VRGNIIYPYCDQHLPIKQVDEYTPDMIDDSFAIPYSNMPDEKDEIHVWREDGNLFMHFADEVEN
jgi:hypothetical protein